MAGILVGSPTASLATALERFFANKGHLVITADTPSHLVRSLWGIAADVLIVDLGWSEAENQRLCAYFLADPSLDSTSVVYLVWSEAELGGAARRGKDLVLVKPLNVGRLETTVSGLLQPGAYPEPPVVARPTLSCGSLTLNPSTFQVTVGTQLVATTPTEFSILRELMRRTGEVVTVDELLREVWGYAAGLGSPELIRVHIKNLRSKLAAADSSEFNPIRTVPRHGYLIPSDVASWTS